MNSGPGSKAEARRRNVQEKKFKLEEVPELKRLKRLSLRLHGPTQARPQLKIFKIFKYSKVPQSTTLTDPFFYIMNYWYIIIAYSLRASSSVWIREACIWNRLKLVRICTHKQVTDTHRTRLRACQCPHQLRCYRQLQLPPTRRPLPLWRGDMRRPGVAMCCHPWISMMIPPNGRISHVFPCCWQWGMRNGSDVNVPWPDWNEDGTLMNRIL